MTSEPALRETFGNFLVDNGNKYKDMVVLDADLSSSTGTYKFAQAFPERFFNMGIAEQNMLGTALGLAISGKIPIVSGFSIFTTGRAWEFIRLACHDNLNVKIITTHGGFVGEDGSTHHALEDLSLVASLPNMTILVPADNIELIQMLDYAMINEGPYYIRLPRGSFPNIHNPRYKFSLGKPDLLKKGTEICLLGTGYGSILASHTAKIIEETLNTSVLVLNISTIKPLDSKILLNQIKNIKAVVVIEEHNIYCGLGSILARVISEINPLPMKCIGINNSFGESGNRKELLSNYGLTSKNVIEQVKELLKKLK